MGPWPEEKMEVPEENEIGHFSIKLGQSREVSRGMAVTIFHSFSESLNKWRHVGQWTGCQNGKANFGGSDPTVQRQVTLEEVPNILVGMNQNRPVLLTSHRNFQNLCRMESTLRARFSVLGYTSQPSLWVTLAELTFHLFLCKIQPNICTRIANPSRGRDNLDGRVVSPRHVV